jgi:NAD(P)-dependent dehydrogenase (short-subunit alcohol dehydrogenase family)
VPVDSTPLDASALDLTGKVAVVTGAARGLGEAVALALGRCGAQLAICDRDETGLTATAGQLTVPPVTSVMDVRDAAAVSAFAEAVGDRYGGVDILVNNAGGVFYSHVLDISARGEAALVAENFTSVTLMIRSFVPLLRGAASIINVTSVEAFRAAPGFAIYAAMKAALENLSKSLALEFAPRGIRVNTLAPDAIPTPGDEEVSGAASRGQRLAYEKKVPLGFGTADDFAGAALFLASPLSRFVTGSTIHIDGGSSAASGWEQREDGTYAP